MPIPNDSNIPRTFVLLRITINGRALIPGVGENDISNRVSTNELQLSVTNAQKYLTTHAQI